MKTAFCLVFFIFILTINHTQAQKNTPKYCKFDPNHQHCKKIKEITHKKLPKFCSHDPYHIYCKQNSQKNHSDPQKNRKMFPQKNQKNTEVCLVQQKPKIEKSNLFIILMSFLVIFIFMNIASSFTSNKKKEKIKKRVQQLLHEGNLEELKKINVHNLESPELSAKIKLALDYDVKMEQIIQYKTTKVDFSSDLKSKLETAIELKRVMEYHGLNLNFEKLNLKMKQLEIEHSILHAIGNSTQWDINDNLITICIDRAERLDFNSEIVQYGKEILNSQKNIQTGLDRLRTTHEPSLLESILESTPMDVKNKLYLTIDYAMNEMSSYRVRSKDPTPMMITNSSKQSLVKFEQDDDLMFEEGFSNNSNINNILTNPTAIKLLTTQLKIENDNFQNELNRQSFEKQTKLKIAQQKQSDLQIFECEMKKLKEKSKLSSFKEEELKLEKEKFEKQKEIFIQQEKENLLEKDLNNFSLLLLIQSIFSFLIYAFGSFETILHSRCSFNSSVCFMKYICFTDLSYFTSICEKSIIISLGIGLLLFLIVVSYFQLGQYGMLFLSILIFYYKNMFLDLIGSFGVLCAIEFIIAYLLSGRKWMMNGKDFRLVLNLLFALFSSFFWFYLTVYMASNKNKYCSDIRLWNQCEMITKLFKQ
eukprot:gene11970-5371_t